MIFINKYIMKKTGYIRGIRFEIKDVHTIRVWKPDDIDFYSFKSKCDLTVKYLIDEGFFNKNKCKVEVVT